MGTELAVNYNKASKRQVRQHSGLSLCSFSPAWAYSREKEWHMAMELDGTWNGGNVSGFGPKAIHLTSSSTRPRGGKCKKKKNGGQPLKEMIYVVCKVWWTETKLVRRPLHVHYNFSWTGFNWYLLKLFFFGLWGILDKQLVQKVVNSDVYSHFNTYYSCPDLLNNTPPSVGHSVLYSDQHGVLCTAVSLWVKHTEDWNTVWM